MHLIQWILYLPLHWCYALGGWISNTVFAPFSIGTTAKAITEEELGVYGVLAFLINRILILPINAYPRFRPAWLHWDWRRALQLCGLALVVSYLVSIVYVGCISPTLKLTVGTGGLGVAWISAWGALLYRYGREIADEKRKKDEKQAEEAAAQAAKEHA